jgi:hypothetical protein
MQAIQLIVTAVQAAVAVVAHLLPRVQQLLPGKETLAALEILLIPIVPEEAAEEATAPPDKMEHPQQAEMVAQDMIVLPL